MADSKFITLEGLARFKELLDAAYSARLVTKSQDDGDSSNGGDSSTGDDTLPAGDNFASDEEVDNMLDDIFT